MPHKDGIMALCVYTLRFEHKDRLTVLFGIAFKNLY